MTTTLNPQPEAALPSAQAPLHDAYAADYDAQVCAYDCHIADLVFGLCYEYFTPGQRLLDVGIGSGVSSQSFARAGLEIYGLDFSPAMLEVCRAKGFAVDLKQQDIQQIPWPYPSTTFDLVISCGVFHFLADLQAIFAETQRVVVPGGLFAFTTRLPGDTYLSQHPYEHQMIGGFEIYSHSPGSIEALLSQNKFKLLKRQKCFIGEDIFQIWITSKNLPCECV